MIMQIDNMHIHRLIVANGWLFQAIRLQCLE